MNQRFPLNLNCEYGAYLHMICPHTLWVPWLTGAEGVKERAWGCVRPGSYSSSALLLK